MGSGSRLFLHQRQAHWGPSLGGKRKERDMKSNLQWDVANIEVANWRESVTENIKNNIQKLRMTLIIETAKEPILHQNGDILSDYKSQNFQTEMMNAFAHRSHKKRKFHRF